MEKSERGGIEPSATTGESTSVTSTESDTDGGFSRRTFLDAAAALTLLPQTASAATPSVEQVVEDRSVADDGTYALTDCDSVPGNLNDIRVQAKMNDGGRCPTLITEIYDFRTTPHTLPAFSVDPAGEVVPFRTIFDGERFALRIGIEDGERPSARLGSRPWRSWASAWNRLIAHPLDTDSDKYDMALDANLRRTLAWSTALQYIEDYAEWRPDR
jgi:hypothetical protein